MSKNPAIEYKNLSQLILDHNNDRFAELYSGSKKEADLIEYLLYTEAAHEVAQSISGRGFFYNDQPLWVIATSGGFLVKDGNRRCAAAKALQTPTKYNLGLPKLDVRKLPVQIYTDLKELERRVQEQHTDNLFREWDRIAKALKVFRMQRSGSSEESILEIDSNPSQLIKLASFYYEAVKVGGEDLKKLLRRGRGNTGGKTIVFERLFPYSKLCGYRFKNKPEHSVDIVDQAQFSSYINALVAYLYANPDTGHKILDDEKTDFLKRLKAFGFTPKIFQEKSSRGSKTPAPPTAPVSLVKKGSVKLRPVIERKNVAPKLKRIIDECYNLDSGAFSNAKTALARVVFEAILKYIVKETDFKGKKLADSNWFRRAFYDKKGGRLKYTDFDTLRIRFIELIVDTGDRNAFNRFDLDALHQVIHNYKIGAAPTDARTTVENLISLIEFMLKDPVDLLNSLDVSKL